MDILLIAAVTLVALLLGAGALHGLGRAGAAGRAIGASMARAPMLDVVVGYFTVAPLVAGPIAAGWRGLLGAVIGQVATVLVWTVLHELANRRARRGPRILKVLNGIVGPARNYAAVWLTAIVVPLFWVIRVVQVLLYPLLTLLVRLPRYEHGDWINVSRHKFEGLVGHDLIWCLYCDWMTGVWSLGSEMLRNVESFWCPIRFADGKKCEHCRIDFPDVDGGWIDAHGTMADVAGLLASKYGAGDAVRHHPWFGHPARLTVDGETPAAPAPDREESASTSR